MKIEINTDEISFKTDDKVKELLRSLNDSEYSYLKESIQEEGCREPLIVWEEKNILLDGHHRLSLCQELGIGYRVKHRSFDNWGQALEWVIKNQLAKRNLNDRRYEYLTGKRYKEEKKNAGGRADRNLSGAQNDHPKTAEKIAREEKTSQAAVRRDANFADSVDKVTKNLGKEFQEMAVDKEEIPKSVTTEIAKVEKGDQEKIFDAIKSGKSIRKKDMKAYQKSQKPVREKALDYVEKSNDITLKDALTKAKKRINKKKNKGKTKSTFNETNDKIEWAKWSWNPVTGCKGPNGNGPCKYCYARDIANRFYDERFKPTFRPNRLDAPRDTEIPESRKGESGIRNVFVCSMGDLFGDWVPDKWIEQTMKSVQEYSSWNYLFLTKNPSRLQKVDFTDNSWVGATVEIQKRVKPTIESLPKANAPIKFISCEPLMERIKFPEGSLEEIDWIIIGGRSKSSKMKAGQPEWEWVESILKQGRREDCKVYFKPNLRVRPKEYPIID